MLDQWSRQGVARSARSAAARSSFFVRSRPSRSRPPARRPRTRAARFRAASSTRAAPPFPAPPLKSSTSPPASSRRRRRTSKAAIASPFLNPGTYRVTVSLTGFSKFISDNIELHVADLLTVDATLKVGAITDEVTVTATAATVDRTTAELGQVVDARRIAELPIREGSPVELVILAPGVTVDDRPAVAQGRLQQRPVAVLDRRRRREEERLHHRRRVERRQRSRGVQPAVGVGRGVQDPHDVLRRGDRQHDGRGREPGDQERHQHPARAGLRVVPRRGARRARTTSTSATTARSATTTTTGSAAPSAARSSRTGRSTSPMSRRTRSRSRRRTS